MSTYMYTCIKAEEDLYLTGSENTIRRVTAETNYSCLMLKTQRFSSLFRHYAKYHGLRKDDLEYYFVNPLENEDTPESVQLQRGDTIMVRKRRRPAPPEAASDDSEFVKDMRELLDDEEHMDVRFVVPLAPLKKNPAEKHAQYASHTNLRKKRDVTGDLVATTKPEESTSSSFTVAVKIASDPESEVDDTMSEFTEIRAHKCILTARAEYFKAEFRKYQSNGGTTDGHVAFKESNDCVIHVEPHFSPRVVRLILEFIYTNRILGLSSVSTDDLLSLLHLSDFWLLRDCKRLVEHELIRSHMDVNTVARMYCATEDYNAKRLSKACIEFIMENIREVAGNVTFQEEMKNHPHLCIPVLRACSTLIPEPLHKKQRTSEPTTLGVTTSGAPSSPVPDSDA